jgi:hypothetical protein
MFKQAQTTRQVSFGPHTATPTMSTTQHTTTPPPPHHSTHYHTTNIPPEGDTSPRQTQHLHLYDEDSHNHHRSTNDNRRGSRRCVSSPYSFFLLYIYIILMYLFTIKQTTYSHWHHHPYRCGRSTQPSHQ